MTANNEYITLSQMQMLIKGVLSDSFSDAYWVVAEISELKVNNSGHCYIELVEKSQSGNMPQAKVNAIIWRSTHIMLLDYFTQSTGMRIEAGMKVLVKIEINYHELYGLSFIVRDIDPSYTLGDIERAKQQTINQLKSDGVFDMNREIIISEVFSRIAVISSDKAAGYQDFCKEIDENEYGYKFDIELFSAVMQGGESEDSIIGALENIIDKEDFFDAVVIIRGGGSKSDLSCFNNYRLCSHISQFPLPIITGIGHDKDISVADMVAAISVKTPTAAARFVIDKSLQFEKRLDSIFDYIRIILREAVSMHNNILMTATNDLKEIVRKLIYKESLKLQNLRSRLNGDAKLCISRERNTLNNNIGSLRKYSGESLSHSDRKLSDLHFFIADRSRYVLGLKGRELQTLEAIVEGYSPQRILKAGYAVVKNSRQTIRKVDDAELGETLKISLFDGVLITKVKDKIYDSQK